jgi:ABC-type transport system substrate-binding protein
MLLPKHIFEKIAPADWSTTPFATGTGSIDVGGTTYYGPVGTGPYKWVDYDSVNQIVHLEKFDQYWNKTDLEADGLFEVEDYYVRFIVDKTSALAALKNNEVDILDPQYTMQADIPTIEPSWGTVLLQEATGSQEIGYQLNHTIWGTGVDTPLGQANASRAAEAARYVRTAFDYAIPRQLIIDNLLDGFGTPAATWWAPHYTYYNSSITARPYDLVKAAEYLEKAGYTVPEQPVPAEATFFIGNSLSLYGVYTDPATKGVLPERDLELRQTTDNSTFETIGVTTTDFAGRYFFTVTPNEEGTFYYWLYDTEFAAIGLYEKYNGTYIRKLTVESFSDALDPLLSPIDDQISGLQAQIQNMTIVAVIALVLSLALGFYGIYLGRSRP